MFRAADNPGALSVEDAFAVLAAGVPALRELEHQVIASRSAAGWEDRGAGERTDEILESLNRLVGPEAPAGSLFVRSEVAEVLAINQCPSPAEFVDRTVEAVRWRLTLG